MALTSGSTAFTLPLHEAILESFSRIGMRGPILTVEHVVEARRSMNLVLQEWSGARAGPPLWAVDLVSMPMVPGVSTYLVPPDTIQILDAYRRQFVAGSTPSATLGAALTPITNNGVPLTGLNGLPLTAQASGVFSTVAGSAVVTMNWPNHGQSVGMPIFFTTWVTVGTVSLPGATIVNGQPSAGTTALVTVNSVIDANNLTFLLPGGIAATTTLAGSGGTALFATTNGSGIVNVYLPAHGLTAGGSFSVEIATTVGGVTIPVGNYQVVSVVSANQFTIQPGGVATSTICGFENGGQIQIITQDPNSEPTDLIMTPLSRTEYASFPQKGSQGLPTVFWFDRTITPSVSLWQVPPSNQSYGFQFYRWRQLQDANPLSGQIADLPNRALPCFTAFLTAALAEKYKPEVWEAKLAQAERLWERFTAEDVENTPLYIMPSLHGYWD